MVSFQAACNMQARQGQGHDYPIRVHYEHLSDLTGQTVTCHRDRVKVVNHDWSSALGFHWYNMHRDRVKVLNPQGLCTGIPLV